MLKIFNKVYFLRKNAVETNIKASVKKNPYCRRRRRRRRRRRKKNKNKKTKKQKNKKQTNKQTNQKKTKKKKKKKTTTKNKKQQQQKTNKHLLFIFHFSKLFKPPHDETIKLICAPSEDSDHQPSLIRVFAVRSMGS